MVALEGGHLMLDSILRWVSRHVKSLRKSQVTTLSYLTVGLIRGGRAGVAGIGRHLPGAAFVKHKIKRVDRFLGNGQVDLAAVSQALLGWATRQGGRLVLLLDWTDLPGGKKMLSAAVPTRGRALPLHCRVVDERVLAAKSQNRIEEAFLSELMRLAPAGVKVVLVADRGFGRTELMRKLKRAGVSFVIRVKGDAVFRDRSGRRRRVEEVSLLSGDTQYFPSVRYRDEEPEEVNLVLTRGWRMKEPWFLATDLEDRPREIIEMYGRRMQIEECFRDAKSVRWGFKLRHVRLGSCLRWERLMMVVALAYLFLMGVGAQAEKQGKHRGQMANTSRKRTLSWLTLGRACLQAFAPRLTACLKTLQPQLVVGG
jgi:DDE family transposase